MVDAFTWTKGNEIRTFGSRSELYDHMVEVGDVIIEGDDAPKFKAHAEKRAADKSHRLNARATAAVSRLEG